jgi:uncharacterized OB-fold protein
MTRCRSCGSARRCPRARCSRVSRRRWCAS